MSWQVSGYATESEKPFDQGSFGTVWRARRVSDDARVALKLVLLTDAADSRERIAAERHGAMLQQRFQQAHGMVPTVYDFGYDADENLFIAMELVEGGALTDLIKTAPVDPNVAAGYAIRICEFLDRAHSFATTVEGEPYDRLVHADLKPSHLLVGPSGDVKVLDFGIAKALAKTTQVTTNNWGTSAYASPERLEHGHVNEHVDFWSLGVILYEMLAGHRPYPGLERNPSQLERAIRGNAPRAPLPASCPAALASIVSKLLAYQIEHRYPTAAAIKSDLQLFLDGQAPLAMSDYATPATMPIARSEQTQPIETARVMPPVVEPLPPTDPLPAIPPAPPAVPTPAPVTKKRHQVFDSRRRVGGDAPVARRHHYDRGRRMGRRRTIPALARRHRRPSTGRDTRELRGHPGAEHARHRAARCVWTGCFVPAWWRWPTE